VIPDANHATAALLEICHNTLGLTASDLCSGL
jgi:hypothetical protein